MTAAYRGQATTNELRAGVIGRVAALLPFPRVAIPTSLIRFHVTTHASCLVLDQFRRPLRGRIMRYHHSLGSRMYLV